MIHSPNETEIAAELAVIKDRFKEVALPAHLDEHEEVAFIERLVDRRRRELGITVLSSLFPKSLFPNS